MPDIDLRFHKDMLVVTAPIEEALSRLDVSVDRDMGYMLLFEPEVIEDAYRLEMTTGAQCVVAPTARFTPAQLARWGMETRAEELAEAALALVKQFKPQHLLVEIAPCGLPLDFSSKPSLLENRDQYTRTARLFEPYNDAFDAYFLNGFRGLHDLRCALVGMRKVTDKPIFASVELRDDGMLANGRDTLEAACIMMEDLQASVVGCSTKSGVEQAVELGRRMASASSLPLMMTLVVDHRDDRQMGPTADNPYYCADTMVEAAEALRTAGVQFLRAGGAATPAYTGALAATVSGLDVFGTSELWFPMSSAAHGSQGSGSRNHRGTNREKSPYYGALQDIVHSLFEGLEVDVINQVFPTVRRLDVVLSAEAADLPDDLLSIVKLLPRVITRGSVSVSS